MTTMEEDRSFPKKCIIQAMKKFDKKVSKRRPDRFKICNEKEKVKVSKSRTPPCLSYNYINMVHNSFTKTMKCLNIPAKEIFPLFTVESHFIVNSISTTGAEGMGHLISDTIKTINREEFSKNIRMLKKDHRPECRKLSKLIKKLNHKNACSAVGVPKNPLSNFFYSGINWNINQVELASMIGEKQVLDEKEKRFKDKVKKLKKEILKMEFVAKSIRHRKDLFKIRKKLEMKRLDYKNTLWKLKKYRANRVMKDDNLRKIVVELSLYAHNWGGGGTRQILRSFLKGRKVRKLSYKTFTGAKGLFLKHYLKISREKANRKEEKANYVFVGVKKNRRGKIARGSASTIKGVVSKINNTFGSDKECASY